MIQAQFQFLAEQDFGFLCNTLATAAAMNLVRVSQWLANIPLAKTRQSAFVRLWSVPAPA
jgi:hypothetical protein